MDVVNPQTGTAPSIWNRAHKSRHTLALWCIERERESALFITTMEHWAPFCTQLSWCNAFTASNALLPLSAECMTDEWKLRLCILRGHNEFPFRFKEDINVKFYCTLKTSNWLHLIFLFNLLSVIDVLFVLQLHFIFIFYLFFFFKSLWFIQEWWDIPIFYWEYFF